MNVLFHVRDSSELAELEALTPREISLSAKSDVVALHWGVTGMSHDYIGKMNL